MRLAILIAVALFVGACVHSLAQTPSPEQTVTQQQPNQVTELGKASLKIDKALADYTWWLAIFTSVLAVATLALWCIAYLQWRDTRITQRAYLSVMPLDVAPLALKGVAHFAVQNVGKLPARKVSWFIDCDYDGNGQRPKFPIDDNEFYPIAGESLVIHPGAEMKRSKNFSLTDEQQLNVLRTWTEPPQGYLYLWGEIRYEDGFGVSRYTKFSLRYDSRGYRKADPGCGYDIFITGESARFHQFGNDAD